MTLQDIRILAVDDEPNNLNVLNDMLMDEGVELLVATSGEKGLAVADACRPDLVLLDINMPGIDGFETCRRLRERDYGEDLPVVFVTAQDASQSVVEGFDVGGSDYVTKPFDRQALLARIKSQLERSRLPRAREEESLSAMLDSPEILDALRGTRLFHGVGTEALRELLPDLRQTTLSSGKVLIRQGSYASAVHVLLSGRLRTTVSTDGADRAIGEIGRGEVVGETTVLTGRRARYTVVAIRDSILVQIPEDAIARYKRSHPEILENLGQLLADRVDRGDRLRAGGSSVSAQTTIALVPASGDVPLNAFARQLADTLRHHGTVQHLDAPAVDHHVGSGAAQTGDGSDLHRSVAAYLNQQEAGHRFVLYESDASASAWTARCLRHADRVLIVGRSGQDPRPSAVEAEIDISAGNAQRELVLLHDSTTTQPTGTAAWLQHRDAARHHHVKLGDDTHMPRLGRILAGNAICLVLSGGVSYGYAHFGVIRALVEAGIPIDLIGGNSAGAGVAGHYALGQTQEDALALHEHWIVRKRSVQAYTLPLVSVVHGGPYNRTVRAMFGDHRIEDTWIPYYCVSTNLTKAALRVHRDGPVWEAVRASTSMPGYFPPFVSDGDLLVDGGVINNMPVNVMRDLCEGVVIASNVSVGDELARYADDFSEQSGWKLLLNRLNPFTRTIHAPGMTEVIGRMMEVCRLSANPEDMDPDFELRPPVQAFHGFDPKPFRQIVSVGYESTKQSIALLKAEDPALFERLRS